jgi:hypothetical protein
MSVCRLAFTSDARVQALFIPCGICGGLIATMTGFPPEFIGIQLSVSFHRCSLFSYIIWSMKKIGPLMIAFQRHSLNPST